jgi:hypothetical protein
MWAMLVGLVFFTLTVFAREIVEFDSANATIWMNPEAWNTLSYDYKIKTINGLGESMKNNSRFHFYWTIKEMGTGLKLATFKVTEKGAENIKILVN